MNPYHGDLPDDQDEDWLDALLSQVKPPAIEDAGFSRRVMQEILPIPQVAQARAIVARGAEGTRRATVFTVAGAMAGLMLAAWNVPWSALAETGATHPTLTPLGQVPMPAAIGCALAMLGMAAVAYAIQDE